MGGNHRGYAVKCKAVARHRLRLARIALETNNKVGAIKQLEIGEAILVALLTRVGDNAQYTHDLAQLREALAILRAQ